MPLLNKFVTYPSSKKRVGQNESSDNTHLASIISNLQMLLQSRRTTDVSHNIGLDDFNDLSIDESLMHRLCSDIQQQIGLHECRLSSVNVELAENGTTRWLLSVTAKLVSSINKLKEETNLKDNVSFTLEITKPAYRTSKKATNGVFL